MGHFQDRPDVWPQNLNRLKKIGNRTKLEVNNNNKKKIYMFVELNTLSRNQWIKKVIPRQTIKYLDM